MTRFYLILSVAGWVWLIVLGGYIIFAHRRSVRHARRDLPPLPKDGTDA